MKTIKTAVYETDDGRLWKDKAQAKRHQAWLDLVALCVPIVQLEAEGVGEQPETLARELASTLLANSDALTKLFRADPCEGGGEPNGEVTVSDVGEDSIQRDERIATAGTGG